jgi:hypothetical protein
MADLAVTFSLVAVNTWTLSWYLAVVSVPTATFWCIFDAQFHDTVFW